MPEEKLKTYTESAILRSQWKGKPSSLFTFSEKAELVTQYIDQTSQRKPLRKSLNHGIW